MTVTGITIVVMSAMKMTGGGEGMTMTIVMAMTVVGMLRTDCSVPGLAQPAGQPRTPRDGENRLRHKPQFSEPPAGLPLDRAGKGEPRGAQNKQLPCLSTTLSLVSLLLPIFLTPEQTPRI